MLHDKLEEYSREDIYPFHMPGHKRKGPSPNDIDITEIEGFDDLHDPEGIIKDLEKDLAKIYGVKHAHVLVNGSTAGNLVAIHSALNRHEELLMARNCHKSVYHSSYLRGAKNHYLYPEETNGSGGRISPESVEKELTEHPGIKAVIISSPTYEGTVSDTKEIARICHERDVSFLIDSAHGAHLGFDPYFPESEAVSGADAVIMSLHKTLPALTQTAVLLLPEGSRLINRDVRIYLDIFQTSSPSYVLMSSVSRTTGFLKKHGKEAFERYAKDLKEFYREAEELKKIEVLSPGRDRDPSKILINAEKMGLSGPEAAAILREKYRIETEMATTHHVLAMSTVADEKKDLDRLLDALKKMESEECEPPKMPVPPLVPSDREGHVSESFISVYPPGIPIIIPGEIYTKEVIDRINEALRKGLKVTGLSMDHL